MHMSNEVQFISASIKSYRFSIILNTDHKCLVAFVINIVSRIGLFEKIYVRYLAGKLIRLPGAMDQCTVQVVAMTAHN